MPQQTGTYDIQTLLAARFTSAKDFGMDTIRQVLDAELAAHNMLVMNSLSEFVEFTTDAQCVYGSAVGGTMVEVDEYGLGPTQRKVPGSTVGFPLRLFQHNLGWTNRFLERATPADLAIGTQNAMIAHKKRIMTEFKKAVYYSSNETFYDHLVDNIAITVRRWLNADSEPIPAGPNGETYDGSTETHFTDETSLTAAELTAAILNVVEKGHGGDVRMAISKTDEATVRALTGFTAYVDDRLFRGETGNDPYKPVDHTKATNKAIGIFDAAEVWIKPWAQANYIVIWDASDARKPLKFRQERATSLQGLRIAQDEYSHPLRAQYMEVSFGMGVWTRTNGAVHYFNGATYTDPTIT